jgi:hypothetical protein
MTDLIRARRGTAAEWTAANPVLADGEPGVERDTGKVKFGDGVAAWADRPYTAGSSGGGGSVALPIVTSILTPAGVASGGISAGMVDVPGPLSLVVPAGTWLISGHIVATPYYARARLYNVDDASTFYVDTGFVQQGEGPYVVHWRPRPLVVAAGDTTTIKAQWSARDSTAGVSLYHRFLMAQPY